MGQLISMESLGKFLKPNWREILRDSQRLSLMRENNQWSLWRIKEEAIVFLRSLAFYAGWRR